MAVTWKLTGTVTDIPSERARVLGVRTDDDPVKGSVLSYGPLSGYVETPAQQSAMLNQFKEMYTDSKTKQAQADTVLGDMLSAGEVNLNQWEIDNG